MLTRSLKIGLGIFIILIAVRTQVTAQTPSQKAETSNDTIYANTQPSRGFKPFVYELQKALSQADTVGRKHRIRVNNIGFLVSKTGTIDSTWINFRPRPISAEIQTFLKTARWIPARQDGQSVVSIQDMDIEIYLTKAALKRHRAWRSLAERIITPWSR